MAKQKEKDDDFSIDFDKAKLINSAKVTWKFIVKYRCWFLLLIPLYISFYLHMAPANLDITQQWAHDTVYGSLKNQIASQVASQHPNLDQTYQTELVTQQYNDFVKQNQAQINDQIAQTAAYFKAQFQDDNGVTYLIGIDPYDFLRDITLTLKNGYPGTKIVNGVPIDGNLLAPNGASRGELGLHDYIGIYLYKFVHFFNNKATPVGVFFYLPVILCLLCVIPAYFLARRIAGDIAGFFSGIIIAIHPVFLTRAIGGFADTDAYNILFPLIIAWLIFEALYLVEKKEGFFSKLLIKMGLKKESFMHKYLKPILLSVLAGFFTGVFSFAWTGWWYIFGFIGATLGIYCIYLIIYAIYTKKKILAFEHLRVAVITGVIFSVFSMLFVGVFNGGISFFFNQLFSGPTGVVNMKNVASIYIWPNVYTTVAELNPASYHDVIQSIGGLSSYTGNLLLVLFSIVGVFLTIFYLNKNKDSELKYNPVYFVFIIIWFGAIFYASSQGVRFIMLLVPAFAISFGVALGVFTYYISKLFASMDIKKGNYLIAAIIMIIVGISFIQLWPTSTTGLYGTARVDSQNTVPEHDDTWVNMLYTIRDDSKPNAIINSWWDFGHEFMYFSDRGVTFDGAHQTGYDAHWIGRTLLTSDENEARGILRMLDCGQNDAYDELNKITGDQVHAAYITEHLILIQDRAKAKDYLTHEMTILQNVNDAVPENIPPLTDEQAELVLNKSHCDAPQDYFIASDDMIGKAGVWGHFGSWDFNRAEMYLLTSQTKTPEEGIALLEQNYSLNGTEASKRYYEIKTTPADQWISPWPGYVSSEASCNVVTSDTIICSQIGFIYNSTSRIATVQTQQGTSEPYSMVFLDSNGNFQVLKYENSTFPYSVSLFNKDGSYKAILSYPEIATSMFNRMFFYNGAGLNYLKLFKSYRSVTGEDFYVYKMDWTGNFSTGSSGTVQMENKNNSVVVMKTNMGTIELELYKDLAPNTAQNFIDLINKGFYNNLTFHRVIEGFMIQGGDPNGDGTGGPGYTIKDEINPNLEFNSEGILAMAKTSQPNSAGSQFFITLAPTPWLNGNYTIFGQVISGIDVVKQIGQVKTNSANDMPITPVIMTDVYVKTNN